MACFQIFCKHPSKKKKNREPNDAEVIESSVCFDKIDSDLSDLTNDKSCSSYMQAMMKDQFANYVVQKVLETCDDQQRELILSRIKVHLNALKKYTYGKHIVARVEKLVAAGGTYTYFVLSLFFIY
jgi:uncharacterized membrane protein YheB (UPF0754 family)